MIPGDLGTLTGGYGYDRRILAGLRNLGWTVSVETLDASFPQPTGPARVHAARRLAQAPEGTTVLVDGLAFGALATEAEYEGTRLRLVALVHHPLADETGIDRQTAALLQVSEHRALAAARLVIVTSRPTARALARYHVSADRIFVVEPGTDPAPLSAGSNDGSVHLLCVASLIPRKGHEVLIEALAIIKDLPWHLTCVGSVDRDMATTTRVRTLLRQHGLIGRVTFTGDLQPAELDREYDRADVFVLTTFHEGYGMAVAEALARGLPVISTPTGGITEMVTADAGVLVQPGDVDGLARALAGVINNGDMRLNLAAGARRVRAHLPTWDAAARHMSDVLECVSRRG
jgi:glycosyltransferase involved in cell wall biosynthesis